MKKIVSDCCGVGIDYHEWLSPNGIDPITGEQTSIIHKRYTCQKCLRVCKKREVKDEEE